MVEEHLLEMAQETAGRRNNARSQGRTGGIFGPNRHCVLQTVCKKKKILKGYDDTLEGVINHTNLLCDAGQRWVETH